MTSIRALRKSRGWTMADFAKKLNTQLSNISRLETGVLKAGPRLQERVSQVFEIDARELFSGEGWPLETECKGG